VARILIEDVCKRFGDFEAVKNVSLEIPDGSFTVIVGPSGSGKTSLLRMIGGLETVTSGRISIGDRDMTNVEPRYRDVAFVFQNYALYGHMSVRDNIGFPLRARDVPTDERRRRVDEVAGMLGIEDLLNRRPRALSGGQQQRVAIGRAMVREPSAFLFDEPLSNLDARLRLDMRKEIVRLQRRLGTTAVWVTHDQEEAMAMAHEIVVLHEGQIAQQAKPVALYERPATAHVARTIGTPPMNLIAGVVEGGRFRGPIQLAVGNQVRDGRILLGVRPEDLELAEDTPEDEASHFAARVELVEMLGPRALLTLRVGEQELTSVLSRRALSRVREDGMVTLAVRPQTVHFFDPETELRLPDPSKTLAGVGARDAGEGAR
jgi:multiple sugar transport system ATP-binding protein